MDLRELERLLRAFKVGELDEPEAARRISNLHFEDIGHTRVDHARAERQGFPEVVFGAGENPAPGVENFGARPPRTPNGLLTRTGESTVGAGPEVCLAAVGDPSERPHYVRSGPTG